MCTSKTQKSASSSSAMFDQLGSNLLDQGIKLRYNQDILRLADNKVARLEAEVVEVKADVPL